VLAKQCIEDIEAFQNNKMFLSKSNFVVALALNQCDEFKEKYKKNFNSVYQVQSTMKSTHEFKFQLKKHYPDIIQSANRYCENHYLTFCRTSIADFPMKSSVHAIGQILRIQTMNS